MQSALGELDQSPFHHSHPFGSTPGVKHSFFYPLLRAISKIQINLQHNGRGDGLLCQLLCKHSVCVKALFKSIPEKSKTRRHKKIKSPHSTALSRALSHLGRSI